MTMITKIRNITGTIFALAAIVFVSTNLSAQEMQMKTVLVEKLSSASCFSCANTNKTFHPLIEMNMGKVVQITYPWHDGGHYDPMGILAKDEVLPRIQRYSKSIYFPMAIVNGGKAQSAGSVNQDKLNMAYMGMSDYALSIEIMERSGENVSAKATITAYKDIDGGDLKIYAAVIEKNVVFESAPGSNGEKEFHNIFRTFLTGIDGANLPQIKAGETKVIEIEGDVSGLIKDVKQVEVVAFLQSSSTNEVLQAAESNTVIASVEDEIQFGEFSLFPNITSDYVKIELPSLDKSVEIKIADAAGNIVKSLKVSPNSGPIEMNVKGLPTGAYFAVVWGEGKYGTKKFIKIQ